MSETRHHTIVTDERRKKKYEKIDGRLVIKRRHEIDTERAAQFSGMTPKKPIKYGACGEEGHTAGTCAAGRKSMSL